MGALPDRYGRAPEQTGGGARHRQSQVAGVDTRAYPQRVDDVERERPQRMLIPDEMAEGETVERAIEGLSQIVLHAGEHETAHWYRRSARRRLSERRAKAPRSRRDALAGARQILSPGQATA